MSLPLRAAAPISARGAEMSVVCACQIQRGRTLLTVHRIMPRRVVQPALILLLLWGLSRWWAAPRASLPLGHCELPQPELHVATSFARSEAAAYITADWPRPPIAPTILCVTKATKESDRFSAVFIQRSWARWCDRHVTVRGERGPQSYGLREADFLTLADVSTFGVARAVAASPELVRYDFTLITNDDAFVILPNLRQLLRSLAAHDTPIYFGKRLQRDDGAYLLADAGVVINAAALQLTRLCRLSTRPSTEVDLSRCLDSFGVESTDVRSVAGADRFVVGSLEHAAAFALNADLIPWLRDHRDHPIRAKGAALGPAPDAVALYGVRGTQLEWYSRRWSSPPND